MGKKKKPEWEGWSISTHVSNLVKIQQHSSAISLWNTLVIWNLKDNWGMKITSLWNANPEFFWNGKLRPHPEESGIFRKKATGKPKALIRKWKDYEDYGGASMLTTFGCASIYTENSSKENLENYLLLFYFILTTLLVLHTDHSRQGSSGVWVTNLCLQHARQVLYYCSAHKHQMPTLIPLWRNYIWPTPKSHFQVFPLWRSLFLSWTYIIIFLTAFLSLNYFQ